MFTLQRNELQLKDPAGPYASELHEANPLEKKKRKRKKGCVEVIDVSPRL